MENDKEIKEPYTPENTPNPPQIIDPIKRNDEPGGNEPIKARQKGPAESKSKGKDAAPAKPAVEEKLQAESQTEINDDTAI